jgi:hypothetical protein
VEDFAVRRNPLLARKQEDDLLAYLRVHPEERIGQFELAKRLGSSPIGMKKRLKRLRDAGRIAVSYEVCGDGKVRCTYTVLDPAPSNEG